MKGGDHWLLVSTYALTLLCCVALGTSFNLPILVSFVKLQDEYLPSLPLSAARGFIQDNRNEFNLLEKWVKDSGSIALLLALSYVSHQA